MRRLVLRVVAGVLCLAALSVAAATVYVLVQRARVAQAVAIATPPGIDEAGFVRINGLDQWVTIRGQDLRKPVVLVLHGGPGGAISNLIARMAPLERDYVVVQWDQPGAGRTLARAKGRVDPALDTAAMVRDGLAVTDHVRARLGREKIILVGWSWGSELGVLMTQAAPDRFAAYVGTGQAASAQPERDQWIYANLLRRTAAAHDTKGLAVVQAVGPPPWKDRQAASGALWRISAPYRGAQIADAEAVMAALTAPHWTLADLRALVRGRSALKDTRLEREIWASDFQTFGRALPVPTLIIQGADDTTSPTDHARAWLDRLQTPAKAMVVIPRAGHQVLLTDNAAFTRAMSDRLPALVGDAAWRRLSH